MKYKYYDDNVYKDDTFRALSAQFNDDYQEFERFYSSLTDCETKDEFLRVGSSYLFFVKNGDWHVNVPRSNAKIEYFTNSFKVVALLAIIESLCINKNVDFYQWIQEKSNQNELFPIIDKKRLQKMYDEYKSEYGSIRRCKSFFARLSSATQEKLRNSILIDGTPVATIEKVSDMIYKVRSNFAHDSKSTLEIGSCCCIAKDKNRRVVWDLPMELLQDAFEEGVLAYFREKSLTTAIQNSSN